MCGHISVRSQQGGLFIMASLLLHLAACPGKRYRELLRISVNGLWTFSCSLCFIRYPAVSPICSWLVEITVIPFSRSLLQRRVVIGDQPYVFPQRHPICAGLLNEIGQIGFL